jgi:hypothetical protein
MLDVLGMEEVVTEARSPWQNAYAERLIGLASAATGRAATFHWWAMRQNIGRRRDPNAAAWWNERAAA